MRCSIILPTKNEEKLLPRVLASIYAQDDAPEFEVIVADAYSTDATRTIATSFGAKVVDGGLPGPGRNAGANHARFEWLIFFDADMELTPHLLADAMIALEAKRADFGTVRLLPDDPNVLDHLFHFVFHLWTWFLAPFRPHVPGGAFFVRRDAFASVGGFDETVMFAEDMDLATRLSKAGKRFAYLSNLGVHVSMRRFHRDGYGVIAWRFIRAEWYMLTKGPIRHTELFPYEFDHAPRA